MKKRDRSTDNHETDIRHASKKDMVTIDRLGTLPFQSDDFSLRQIHRVVRERLLHLNQSHNRYIFAETTSKTFEQRRDYDGWKEPEKGT